MLRLDASGALAPLLVGVRGTLEAPGSWLSPLGPTLTQMHLRPQRPPGGWRGARRELEPQVGGRLCRALPGPDFPDPVGRNPGHLPLCT